jgi:sRNA-binding carbon storage regulator CsrA
MESHDRPTSLVLSRHRGERLRIDCAGGEVIWIEVSEYDRGRARLRIVAPRNTIVRREEICGHDERFVEPSATGEARAYAPGAGVGGAGGPPGDPPPGDQRRQP